MRVFKNRYPYFQLLQDETIDEVATPAETPTLPRATPTFTKEQRTSGPDNKTPSGNGQWTVVNYV
jgi:hypothetical protein